MWQPHRRQRPDSATDSVQIFNPDGRLLLMLGKVGDGPGDMQLPAKVILSYEGIEHFAKYAAPGFHIEYLVFVSNHQGAAKINVYGFGTYEGPGTEGLTVDRGAASAGPSGGPRN